MRYQKIVNNQKFKVYCNQIEKTEENRIYCRHDIIHGIDVARICYILVKEAGMTIDIDIIYAMGLMHDLGRCDPNVKDHSAKSVEIANEILPMCGYSPEEIMLITDAIANHRGRMNYDEIKHDNCFQNNLNAYLKTADQLSRNCFRCKAADSCKWQNENKIKNIIY